MSELFIGDHIGELIVGLVLVVFAFAFRNWASTINHTSDKILQKLESLALEFHRHRLETENRVTKCETKVESIENRSTK